MEIFIGPTYYMRLKHMVKDKINYRERGPMNNLTRQPVGGRANDGGLRIGEMERDVLVSHGINNFLNESMMERGDSYKMAVCNRSGTIMALNKDKNISLNPMTDGPLEFTQTEDLQNIVLKKTLMNKNNDFSVIKIPYSFKLLIHELGAINIGFRIITEKNISLINSLSFTNNIYKQKNIENKKNKSLKHNSTKKGGDKIEEVNINDDLKILNETQLNTMMNLIENGSPPVDADTYELFTDPYATGDDVDYDDNMNNSLYDNINDNSDDNSNVDDSNNILTSNTNDDDGFQIIDLNDLNFTEDIIPTTLPTINVSPIINIGNEEIIKSQSSSSLNDNKNNNKINENEYNDNYNNITVDKLE
jgi:DNA-directed RNA polymerase II subunit RPB2